MCCRFDNLQIETNKIKSLQINPIEKQDIWCIAGNSFKLNLHTAIILERPNLVAGEMVLLRGLQRYEIREKRGGGGEKRKSGKEREIGR